jgi:hypothetical protein
MIVEIYSKNGKQIPLKTGIRVFPGSTIRTRENEFILIEKIHKIKIEKGEFNCLTQSKDCDKVILI